MIGEIFMMLVVVMLLVGAFAGGWVMRGMSGGQDDAITSMVKQALAESQQSEKLDLIRRALDRVGGGPKSPPEQPK